MNIRPVWRRRGRVCDDACDASLIKGGGKSGVEDRGEGVEGREVAEVTV
jgi:hypothetical protein